MSATAPECSPASPIPSNRVGHSVFRHAITAVFNIVFADTDPFSALRVRVEAAGRASSMRAQTTQRVRRSRPRVRGLIGCFSERNPEPDLQETLVESSGSV